MADSHRNLKLRVFSALAAAGLALATAYFGGLNGMYLLTAIAIVLGVREFSKLAFRRWPVPASVGALYWASSLLFYVLSLREPAGALLWFSVSVALFFSGTLWCTRGRAKNEDLLPALAVGGFGMIYAVLFPYFCVRLIGLEHGDKWFLFLLLVIFAGDTFAYFGGRLFGKAKLMPQISPGKTVAGAVSGLAGSVLVGVLDLALVGPNVPYFKTISFCLICGWFAQSGDLLISLVKRVADVKDSGQLMPGHGGILDRMDGIFIACPLVYAFALYVG